MFSFVLGLMESIKGATEMAREWQKMKLADVEDGGFEDTGAEVVELNPSEVSQVDSQWTMVGKFLSDRFVNFNAMKSILANLWRPLMGVSISRVGSDRFIFQFFHALDFLAHHFFRVMDVRWEVVSVETPIVW